MQYNRNEMSALSGKQFEVGVHIATIVDVKNQKSKNGDPMFMFDIEGAHGETTKNWFLFGQPWSDKNLQRILVSIEDNNQTIAPMDYGHNQETMNFLKNKRVFIQTVKKTGTYVDKKTGEEKQQVGTEIKNFLCRSEFASFGGGTQQQTTQPDSFAGGAPMSISDDQLPF